MPRSALIVGNGEPPPRALLEKFAGSLSNLDRILSSDIDSYTSQLLLSCCWCKVVSPADG